MKEQLIIFNLIEDYENDLPDEFESVLLYIKGELHPVIGYATYIDINDDGIPDDVNFYSVNLYDEEDIIITEEVIGWSNLPENPYM